MRPMTIHLHGSAPFTQYIQSAGLNRSIPDLGKQEAQYIGKYYVEMLLTKASHRSELNKAYLHFSNVSVK